MRPALVRLVLDLYPAPVRDRYGAEIAELLAGSTRPWRDLADVGRAALGERMAAPTTWTGARTHLLRLAWLTLVPLGLGLGGALVALVPYAIIALLDQRFPGLESETSVNVAMALSVLPVGAEAAWFANRRARLARPVAPMVTVPVALALGLAAVASLPSLGLGAGPAEAAAIGLWSGALVALAIARAVLVRLGHPRLGLAVLLLGAALALVLSVVAAPDPVTPLSLSYALIACTAYALPLVGLSGATARAARPGRAAEPVP